MRASDFPQFTSVIYSAYRSSTTYRTIFYFFHYTHSGTIIFSCGLYSSDILKLPLMFSFVISWLAEIIPDNISLNRFSFSLMFLTTAPSASDVMICTFTCSVCPNLQHLRIDWYRASNESLNPQNIILWQCW